MHVTLCVCMRDTCVRVCVFGREGSWVFASTAQLVAWTAMYLTGYSECVTSLHAPLWPPYSTCQLLHHFEKMCVNHPGCLDVKHQLTYLKNV